MKKKPTWTFGFCLLSAVLILAACGGGDADSSEAVTQPTRTPFPTFAFVEPTKPPAFDQNSEAAAGDDDAAEAMIKLDPKRVERGRGRYQALECAACHGASGEGTAAGIGLLDFALSEEDFVTFMRSGGRLGPDHQYSTNRLSNSGSRNLYQYLASLARDG